MDLAVHRRTIGRSCARINPRRMRDTWSCMNYRSSEPRSPRYIYLSMIVNNLMAKLQRTELLAGWKMADRTGPARRFGG